MNTEIWALNAKGEFYRIYNYCKCSNCKIETDNANIKLAYHEEGTIRGKWFCPECYEEFRGQLLDFIEGRSKHIESLLFDEEEGGRYTIEYLSPEMFYRLTSELYEVHRVWELKFMDEVTYYKYK